MSDHDDATVDVSVEGNSDVRLPPPADPLGEARRDFAERLVEEARATGVNLVGPGGLLSDVTKRVLETGLDVELTEHLGYEKHAVEGRDGGNSRNGTRAKTVLTDVGPVELNVPRDRDGTFDPVLVRKRQRRLEGVDAMIISLCAKGLTTGEIAAHFDEVYGASISKETISKITDASRASGTSSASGRAPGPRARSSGSGVLTEIKNRGVGDVCIVVCDGLKGLPDAINTTWPKAIVQTCVLHLLRNTFRLASRQHWAAMAKDLQPVYTAVNESEARARFEEFCDSWAGRYPAVRSLWENAWGEFVPFLDYSVEIRRVIYSTNAIESLHARMRRATRSRGHFPNEQAAMKCLYLVVRSLDPTGKGATRWMNRWKPALNAFALTFEGRLFPIEN